MSVICRLFGHTMRHHAGHGADYGRVVGGNEDGIGRAHWQLRVRCSRCGAEYHAGSFHGPLQLGANPQSAAPVSAEWLWCELMGWCKKRGASPADHSDLFAIVGKMRKTNGAPK